MAALTDLLRYDMPSVTTQTRNVYNPGGITNRFQTQERKVVEGPSGPLFGTGGSNPLDDLLAGYDKESASLTKKLKSIYDSYTGSYEELEGKVQPIMDLIEGDIGKFEEYMGDYEGLVSGMKGDFLDSIIVDPNAARTRGEYMGNVASQYEQAEDAMRRQAIQQGQNPYANRGAAREMALSRAGDMAGAANQAYGDWREQYNRDIQRQQQANEAYANLYGKKGEMYGDLLGARSGLIGAQKGLMDTRLAAEQARASGYEGLLGLEQQKRQQALELGQQQASMRAQAVSQANQMKDTMKGQTWYNPNFNAGGSQQWS